MRINVRITSIKIGVYAMFVALLSSACAAPQTVLVPSLASNPPIITPMPTDTYSLSITNTSSATTTPKSTFTPEATTTSPDMPTATVQPTPTEQTVDVEVLKNKFDYTLYYYETDANGKKVLMKKTAEQVKNEFTFTQDPEMKNVINITDKSGKLIGTIEDSPLDMIPFANDRYVKVFTVDEVVEGGVRISMKSEMGKFDSATTGGAVNKAAVSIADNKDYFYHGTSALLSPEIISRLTNGLDPQEKQIATAPRALRAAAIRLFANLLKPGADEATLRATRDDLRSQLDNNTQIEPVTFKLYGQDNVWDLKKGIDIRWVNEPGDPVWGYESIGVTGGGLVINESVPGKINYLEGTNSVTDMLVHTIYTYYKLWNISDAEFNSTQGLFILIKSGGWVYGQPFKATVLDRDEQ